jgi:APA family basic amino acid/polyamine antiporter
MENTGFKKVMSFKDVMLLMVGGIISTWLYILPGAMAAVAGASSLLVWVVGAVLTIGIGLCCAELATAFPKAGGLGVYPYEILGRKKSTRAFWSCLAGIGSFISNLIFVAITSIMMAEYFNILVPAARPYTGLIGMLFVVLAFLIVLKGLSATESINFGMLIMLFVILGVTIITYFSNIKPSNFQPFFLYGTGGFIACLPLAITSFSAWINICCLAEEIHEPEKTIPKAIVWTIILSLIIQGVIALAVYCVVNPAEFIAGSSAMAAPLGYVAEKLGYKWLMWLITVSVLPAGFTSVLVGLLGGSRSLVAMGRYEILPKSFGLISKQGTPWVSLLFLTILSSVFAYFPRSLFTIIVIGTLVGNLMPYAINLAAFIGLRYFRKDIKPAYRAPMGLVIPVIALIAIVVGAIGLGSRDWLGSTIALAIILGYFLIRSLTHSNMLR